MGTSRADMTRVLTGLVPESRLSFIAKAAPDLDRTSPVALVISNPRSRRAPSGASVLLRASALAFAGIVSSVSLSVSAIPLAHAPGVVVIPPDEVIAEHTFTAPDGTLLFVEPSGAFVPLVLSTDDPQIANPGDGSFHPADVDAVIEALENLPSWFLAPLEVTVFVLPYPRSFALDSSATDDAVFLSPGVYPLEDGETLRALVCHEMGHVVHRHFLPAADVVGWSNYASLRGIDDPSTFHASAAHAYRPHEIFAEDFRILYGDALAAAPGHENPQLDPPSEVEGLASFFVGLTGAMGSTSGVADRGGASAVELYPNPAPAGERIVVRATKAADGAGTLTAALARLDSPRVSVVDAAGRAVAQLELTVDADGWSGRVPDLAMGAYWLVAPGARAVSLRVSR